jgi:hypothetical protein
MKLFKNPLFFTLFIHLFLYSDICAADEIKLRIFFYQEGIYHAFRYATPPDDEVHITKRWSALTHEYHIDLVVPTKQRPYAFWGLPALAFALHGWQRQNRIK